MTSLQASREIMWNVGHPANAVVMYLVFAASVVVFAFGIFQRLLLWAQGRAEPARLRDYSDRLVQLWDWVMLQRGVVSERKPGIMHTLILWGFVVLLFTTTMVFLDHDLGIDIYKGRFYLAVTVLSDIFGVLLLWGLLWAYHRRFVAREDRLHSGRSDVFLLVSLGLLVVQGYVLEGARIAVTDDPWKFYSPVGYLVSLPFDGFSNQATRVIHFLVWWWHALTVFACIALIPYSKFFHIISSSANLFFREIEKPKGALRFPGDIEKIMEEALSSENGEFRIGAAQLQDLTWKQRLDLDACTSCGRCQDVCPAYRSGKILSPKWLILDTRDHMLWLQAKKEPTSDYQPVRFLERLDKTLLRFLLKDRSQLERDPEGHIVDPDRAKNLLVQKSAKSIGESPEAKLAGEVMDEDVFWSCTTCRACMEVCPVGIEHVDYILDARRSLALMEGNIPGEAQASLRAIETRGNPFGPADQRANWATGIDVPILKAGDEVEVLYWVGCISSYDKRKQRIARSMAQILNASGIKWGILGNAERCTGDPARRLGEENLFQNQGKQNIATLSALKFQTVVANCPHCFNTLRNEYPQLGAEFGPRVIHHSEFIQGLIHEGKIAVKGDSSKLLTFHDPCYLGRYNDRYNEPRDVLVQLGGKINEMGENRERGMCCGAGGGHYWFDMKVGSRVNTLRVDQAAETGAEVIATGCPFCLQMMEDGVKLTNREESLEVRDLAELVAEALLPQSA